MRAVLPVLVALALGACSDSGGSGAAPAATVGGHAIPAEDLVDEMDAIAANTAFVEAHDEAAAANGEPTILAEDGDEFVTEFVTDTLGIRIQYDIVSQEVDRLGLEVSDTCTELAREDVEARFTLPDGEELLSGFGEAYSTYLVERQADFLALQAELSGIPCGEAISEEAVQAYFEANEEQLTAEEACASHILVATVEEAQEVVALLEGGEDFATLAAERSLDAQSGAAGGQLGCAPAGQYVQEFDDAVFSQPVGEVGEPVETEFGVHVILVTERSAPSAEQVRAQIEAALQQESEAAFAEWFTAALADTEVVVDPRYGDWDATQATIVRPTPTEPVIVDSGEG